MKVLVQWSLLRPADWEEIDASDWAKLPYRPEPTGGESIDNDPGWVYDLNVQGINFGGYDHYAVEPVDDGVRVVVWNDDLDDREPGAEHGLAWLLLEPAFDERVGAVNTRQFCIKYLGPNVDPVMREPVRTTGGPVLIRPWAEFKRPDEAITRHGIWLPDDVEPQHVRARRRPDLAEWMP